MDTVFNNTNIDSFNDVLESFYTLTKVRIVIFDVNYNKIASYPESDCEFCKLMQTSPTTKLKCTESNTKSFENCKRTKNTAIYLCHAGLIEATSPLIDDNGLILGYVMFGQVSSSSSRDKMKASLIKYLKDNNIKYPENDPSFFDIKNRNKNQIIALSNILEMCTKYLILKNYIKYQKESFIDRLNSYIDDHIGDNLEIKILMDEFHLSRNALCNASKEYLNVGIAEYIKNRRILKAKQLLTTTDYKINVISTMVGFSDYNYFCRTFKKEVGISAKKYRKTRNTK